MATWRPAISSTAIVSVHQSSFDSSVNTVTVSSFQVGCENSEKALEGNILSSSFVDSSESFDTSQSIMYSPEFEKNSDFSDISFSNSFVSETSQSLDSSQDYESRDHASPEFSGDVTSPSRRFRAMF